MKNKKNYLAVLGILLLLLLAYMVPTVITILEDKYLQSKSKEFEIEGISLNTDEADLREKLATIQEVLQDNVLVKNSQEDSSQEKTDLEASQEENDLEKQVKEFLTVLDDNTETDFVKSSASKMVLMDSDANKVYSLWKYISVDSNAQKYILWIDVETEKVLAFEIPFFTKDINSEDFYKLAYRLAEYYGFTGSEIIDKVSVLLKEKYSKTALRFYYEADGTEVVLMLYRNGEQLSFNMYPSQIAVYDTSSDSD